MADPDSESADMLYGVPPMAAHLRLKVPQVRHLIRKHGLPTFKVGRLVCARRSSLNRWLAEREAEAQRGRIGGAPGCDEPGGAG